MLSWFLNFAVWLLFVVALSWMYAFDHDLLPVLFIILRTEFEFPFGFGFVFEFEFEFDLLSVCNIISHSYFFNLAGKVYIFPFLVILYLNLEFSS